MRKTPAVNTSVLSNFLTVKSFKKFTDRWRQNCFKKTVDKLILWPNKNPSETNLRLITTKNTHYYSRKTSRAFVCTNAVRKKSGTPPLSLDIYANTAINNAALYDNQTSLNFFLATMLQYAIKRFNLMKNLSFSLLSRLFFPSKRVMTAENNFSEQLNLTVFRSSFVAAKSNGA